MFTDKELAFLRQQPIGRLGTADAAGQPHVVPTGFQVDDERGAIEIGGHDPGRGRERRYRRNIRVNPKVAFVVDDLVSTNPWTPRAIVIHGLAELRSEGGERLGPGFGPTWVEVTPTWISSWGIESPRGPAHARRVATRPS